MITHLAAAPMMMTGRVRRSEKVSMSTRTCMYFVLKNPPPPITRALNRLTLFRDERGKENKTKHFGSVFIAFYIATILLSFLLLGVTATLGDGAPEAKNITSSA